MSELLNMEICRTSLNKKLWQKRDSRKAVSDTMRLSILLVFILLISGVSFSEEAYPDEVQASQDSVSGKPKNVKIDTTASADYLTEIERQIIIEINLVRANPSQYARMFLVPLRSYYHNGLFQYPGEIAISTHEGIRALNACIKVLQVAKPLPPLYPKKGLTLAARDHAKDQAKTGATGHTGSDGSTPKTRLNRYGKWGISAGENIGYGYGEVKGIVASLLIDDGMPSRGHRKNLLSNSFQFVGVAVGTHPVYRYLCVMEFAVSYR